MRLIIDAMGGDNAPEEIVKGAVLAKRELGVDVTPGWQAGGRDPLSQGRGLH
jgi:hypothetical protein